MSLGTGEYRTASVASGDIDGDGDTDVVTAEGRHWPTPNFIFYNVGNGVFRTSRILDEEWSSCYAAELGDLDIITGNDRHPNIWYRNDGKGTFERAGAVGGEATPTRNITLGDIDNDGDLDVLFTNRGSTNEIAINDGSGNFNQLVPFGNDDDSTIAMAIADMNADGFPDLVLANRDEQQNYVYVQTDTLVFDKKIPFGTGKDETRSVGVGDFNNDGHFDIVVGNLIGANYIYLGNGTDYKESLLYEPEDYATASVSIADLNNDGLLDILNANGDEVNYAYMNYGKNSFEKIPINKDSKMDTYDIHVTDINGDGYLDILEANSGDLNVYYLNRYGKIKNNK